MCVNQLSRDVARAQGELAQIYKKLFHMAHPTRGAVGREIALAVAAGSWSRVMDGSHPVIDGRVLCPACLSPEPAGQRNGVTG